MMHNKYHLIRPDNKPVFTVTLPEMPESQYKWRLVESLRKVYVVSWTVGGLERSTVVCETLEKAKEICDLNKIRYSAIKEHVVR